MRKFKVGIIGLGFIGTAHLEALRRLNFIEVVAVAEKNLEKAHSVNVPKVYERWEDLVSDPEVEIVHNCTPNQYHFAINKACIQAGKPIFSEKPLAISSQETGELVDLARQAGLSAGVNFCYRYYPMIQWAKALITTGYLGEIRAIHGRYLQDWLMFETDYNWRVEENQGGRTRALGDIGSHWCDLARYLSGLEIDEVMADCAIVIPVRRRPTQTVVTFQQQSAETEPVQVHTEDWASVLLHYEHGVIGNFIVSQISAGHKNGLEIEIDGSLRSLSWKQEDPEHLIIGERNGANHQLYKDPTAMPSAANQFAHYPSGHNEGFPDCIKNNFITFYAAVEHNEQNYPTFDDGHRIMKVIEAIIQSSAEKRWVKIK
ncbi:MAG TPA: dehydrogenase [Firmicutes bacterium]|jgi:predicted dehydrogenase|nr:dehydrogenase [Bacillota bacterium]